MRVMTVPVRKRRTGHARAIHSNSVEWRTLSADYRATRGGTGTDAAAWQRCGRCVRVAKPDVALVMAVAERHMRKR